MTIPFEKTRKLRAVPYGTGKPPSGATPITADFNVMLPNLLCLFVGHDYSDQNGYCRRPYCSSGKAQIPRLQLGDNSLAGGLGGLVTYMTDYPSVILACGSRQWTDEDLIHRRLTYWREPDMAQVVIHGAAKGADSQAARIAAELGYTVNPFPADWRKHGKPAGIIRNLAMLDQNPDLLIAFQANGSTGTQHTISEARRRGLAVEVHQA